MTPRQKTMSYYLGANGRRTASACTMRCRSVCGRFSWFASTAALMSTVTHARVDRRISVKRPAPQPTSRMSTLSARCSRLQQHSPRQRRARSRESVVPVYESSCVLRYFFHCQRRRHSSCPPPGAILGMSPVILQRCPRAQASSTELLARGCASSGQISSGHMWRSRPLDSWPL